MDLKNKKVVFVLTYIEAKDWNKFYPAWMFGQVYSDYQFIVLDNGNQPLMEEWCKLTGSYYYGAEHNLGSSAGYNWIFRVAEILELDRAVLLQADVEIISKSCLDDLFDEKWKENDIPFWPMEPREMWDTQTDNLGGCYNLGQFFSFNPNYLLSNKLLVDENYVVTHFDDADLMRRMLEVGTKTHNLLLNYEHIDVVAGPDKISTFVAGLYNMYHFSSLQSGSENHKEWLDLNQPYHDKKWFNESKDYAYAFPFGQCDPEDGKDISHKELEKLDINKCDPHSHKWLPLGYPPYPTEYEVNRFWKELTEKEE
ncbi:hypothetical protein N9J02_01385 [bacterium]|jgi:hypothetical protein|nr:hypothetical protein [bacterium]